jgi:hypothetical protein
MRKPSAVDRGENVMLGTVLQQLAQVKRSSFRSQNRILNVFDSLDCLDTVVYGRWLRIKKIKESLNKLSEYPS